MRVGVRQSRIVDVGHVAQKVRLGSLVGERFVLMGIVPAVMLMYIML